MKTKGGSQYVVSAIFFREIGEVKIRNTNPQFFASVRELVYSRYHSAIFLCCVKQSKNPFDAMALILHLTGRHHL